MIATIDMRRERLAEKIFFIFDVLISQGRGRTIASCRIVSEIKIDLLMLHSITVAVLLFDTTPRSTKALRLIRAAA